jgi:16S rRNA processing protein RimM
VVKPQGRHGELSVELFTRFPERFEERRQVLALEPSGERIELEVEDFWPHKGRMVLKFAGVDSISDAEKLVGCEIQIPRQQRAALPPDEFYVSDLLGCLLIDVSGVGVTGEAREVGTVADVNSSAGEAPLLVVRGANNKEFLVPFAQAFVRKLDLSARRIEMALPEGMLELDAPLSQEEKGRQGH